MTAETATHKAVPGQLLKTFAAYLRPYRIRYVLGFCCAIVFVGLGLVTPYIVGQAVTLIDGYWSGEAATLDATLHGLIICAIVLVAASVVSGAARYGERKLIIGASREFEYELRNDFFSHVQSLSRSFFRRTMTGDIMARATNDINFVRMFVGPGIMGFADLIRIPAMIGYMVYLSPQLTLIALLPMPLASFFVYKIIMYTHHKSKEVQERFSDVTARAQENLAGAHVVRAYAIEEREAAAFHGLSDIYMRESIKLAVVQSALFPVINVIMGISWGCVLWWGGRMVLDETLSLHAFSALLTCLMLIAFPLVEFGWILSLYQRGAAGMKRLDDVFEVEPEIRDTEETDKAVITLQGQYRFDHVDFHYGDTRVLENISFELPKGKTLGIVGPTGAGKTTLVSLLTREIDPTQGTILIDGIPSTSLPIQTLRSGIGVVPQDTFLFSDTIENNLRVGAPDASQADLDAACKAAQFTETVDNLRDGYQTLLGERGVNLSGGQKQRLTIARALVRDPAVLILDDALSSVDAHTEAAIIDGLQEYSKGRTTVIVAHRLSAVAHADNILVLDNGQIVERGDHDSLREQAGVYAEIWEQQQLEAAIEEAP